MRHVYRRPFDYAVPRRYFDIYLAVSQIEAQAASATFSTDGRPLVRLGRLTDTLVFGCRVEQVSLDCNSRAKVGLYSTAAITAMPALISMRASGMVCALNVTSLSGGTVIVYISRILGASA